MKTMEIKKIHLNKIFKPVNESKQRYVVCKGSAGSGKSTNAAMKLIMDLSNPTYKGSNLMCVRKVNATNRDSTLAELIKAIKELFGDDADKVWKYPKARTGAMYLKCYHTGCEVIFRGCNNEEDIEKIKSVTFENGKLTWVWLEEATELRENDFNIIDDRLRGDLPDGLFYQMILTFNPVNKNHWIKRRFYDYEDKDCLTSQSTYKNNRFIDKAYYDRMEKRKELDPEGYRIYGLGEWGELGGLVFKNYEVQDFNPDGFDHYYYGQDFGFNHANSIIRIAVKENNLYICNEKIDYEKDMAEIISEANKLDWLSHESIIWCDSAEPDRIKMWRKAGYRAVGVKKEKNSIKGQIDWLKGIISKDEIVPRRIIIHPSCVQIKKELDQYRWKFDKKTDTYMDEPVDFFDDAIASLRYAIEELRKPKATIKF